MYLLDTNVISEFRKRDGAHPGVRKFFASVDPVLLYLPVQVLGEIRAGIAKLRRKGGSHELRMAGIYEHWLEEDLLQNFAGHILEFDGNSAQLWGMLLSDQKKDPHTIDKQIAAIALIRDMTVVTRDQGEAFKGIPHLRVRNPFGEVEAT